MPEVYEVEYLIAYWQDMGMVGSGAMGMTPIAHSELLAWMNGKAIYLSPWEFGTIIEMSRAYISEYYQAETPDHPPPYGTPELEFDRAEVAKKVSSAFKSFIGIK